MWELDHKEGWAPKNWCFNIVVLEKTLESPLDSKEIKPVNPKGNQPQIFTERTDAEAPILSPPDANRWLIGKVPDAGKDCGQEKKGTTEDEMGRLHHWLNGHEYAQTPEACSNSCLSSWWCHPTISSSDVPFSSHLQSFPASGSFPESQFFTSGG